MRPQSFAHIGIALVLAPLLPGIIARVKARVAGRRGQPLMQGYFDLFKLLRKGFVVSDSTTWLLCAGPVVSLATVATALALLPAGHTSAPLRFAADFVVLAYLLALGRFFMVLAALDTGSSFEGMGASREVQLAALAEPTLLAALAVMARKTGASSLSSILPAASPLSPEILLMTVALGILLLCENARIPFDDPNTHLELTMIHEVMILDHGGPDLGILLYASHLKLWLWSALVIGVVMPPGVAAAPWPATLAALIAGILAAAIGIGLVESLVPRLRLTRAPRLLATAAALVAVAAILVVR